MKVLTAAMDINLIHGDKIFIWEGNTKLAPLSICSEKPEISLRGNSQVLSF